ncbi:hypothetical protein ADUPG1_012946, partial [Aduncisulcus paluster]
MDATGSTTVDPMGTMIDDTSSLLPHFMMPRFSPFDVPSNVLSHDKSDHFFLNGIDAFDELNENLSEFIPKYISVSRDDYIPVPSVDVSVGISASDILHPSILSIPAIPFILPQALITAIIIIIIIICINHLTVPRPQSTRSSLSMSRRSINAASIPFSALILLTCISMLFYPVHSQPLIGVLNTPHGSRDIPDTLIVSDLDLAINSSIEASPNTMKHITEHDIEENVPDGEYNSSIHNDPNDVEFEVPHIVDIGSNHNSSSYSGSDVIDNDSRDKQTIGDAVGVKTYEIQIDKLGLRWKVCEISGQGSNTSCDISEYEMAEITGMVQVKYAPGFDSLVGAEYLISMNYASFYDNALTSCAPLANLTQLTTIEIDVALNDDHPNHNIGDVNVLYKLTRLKASWLEGNSSVFDPSVMYRNIGLHNLYLAQHFTGASYAKVCRKESDSEFTDFFSKVMYFSDEDTYLETNCTLNDDPPNSPNNCDASNPLCPSIVLNEVYDNTSNTLECAFIAKSVGGRCYTVHDDTLRSYLITNCGAAVKSNGIISVDTLRTGLSSSCATFSLSAITGSGSENNIDTLQGLEYAQGLSTSGTLGITSLNVSGYQLSASNSTAEYDRLVVQILAKSIRKEWTDSGTTYVVQSGLTSLYASGCDLAELDDILDLTPIAAGDYLTQPFILETLDVSSNHISDVSALISSEFFPQDSLSSLNISDNFICDISETATTLNNYFNSISITSNTQSCQCSESFSFSDYKTCRQRANSSYQVECWDGYYWDKNIDKCMQACPVGESMSREGVCAGHSTITWNNSLRCDVCKPKSDLQSILGSDGAVVCGERCATTNTYGNSCSSSCPVSLVTQTACNSYPCSSNECSCPSDLYGDACEYIVIPDDAVRDGVQTALGYTLDYTFDIST